MHNNLIIRRKRNKILYTEFFIVAAVVGFLSTHLYKVHSAVAFLLGVLSMAFFSTLFFVNRIFRYLFSLTFSLVWAFLAYVLGQLIDHNSDTTALVFMVVAFLL